MLAALRRWGLNTVAMKVGTEGIPPVLQAGLRSAVAAPLLLLWCRWRGVDLGDWRRDGTLLPGLAIGAVFGLEFLFLYTGLGSTTASRAVVFLYTAPFFVALGVHFLLPDDRLTPAKAAGSGSPSSASPRLRRGLGGAGRRGAPCSATRCACWRARCGPPPP
jgi:drug/metabolite transporter (DMT)-like permease